MNRASVGLVWLYADKGEEELRTKIIIVSELTVVSHDGHQWTATRHRDYDAADQEAIILSEWAEAAFMELSTGPLKFNIPIDIAHHTLSRWPDRLIALGTGALLLEGVGFVDMVQAVTVAGMGTILPNQYHNVP